MKNLLVRTKFYWSWAGGPVHIVWTVVNGNVIIFGGTNP